MLLSKNGNAAPIVGYLRRRRKHNPPRLCGIGAALRYNHPFWQATASRKQAISDAR